MEKVFIGVGHGGNDPGAVAGKLKEKDIVLNIALACKDELERHNVEVKLSRYKDENDGVMEEVRECNAFKPKIAVDIHINAGGGDGFEAFHHYRGGLGKTLAANIETEVKKIGQNSRGLKTRVGSSGRDYYAFIRETVCPSIILEAAFIDTKDIEIVDELHEQKILGIAYAKGILKTLGIQYKESDSIPDGVTKEQFLAFKKLVSKGLVSENYWKNKLNKPITAAEIMEIVSKII